MTIFFAHPYDIAASGFYFESAADFQEKMKKAHNDYGQIVEEFELQFIDGEAIDADLANAWGINQANISSFMEAVEDWDDDEKRRYIIAVGECGYRFNPEADRPEDFDVDIYQVESMRELAEQFIDEGLFGEIPEHLAHYIDYDAIARDLAMDYSETEIAGEQLIYRCG